MSKRQPFSDFNLSGGCFGIDTEMDDPKTHEMVSVRSSRAENLTDIRDNSMRVFSGSIKTEKKKEAKLVKQMICYEKMIIFDII